jgi:hypothetical protein
MLERSYTVSEVDALRTALEKRFLFGSCAPNHKGRSSLSYTEEEMAEVVEHRLRTHMIAGHVAQNLIDEDVRKELERRG